MTIDGVPEPPVVEVPVEPVVDEALVPALVVLELAPVAVVVPVVEVVAPVDAVVPDDPPNWVNGLRPFPVSLPGSAAC